jgi:hypothetical protein
MRMLIQDYWKVRILGYVQTIYFFVKVIFLNHIKSRGAYNSSNLYALCEQVHMSKKVKTLVEFLSIFQCLVL